MSEFDLTKDEAVDEVKGDAVGNEPSQKPSEPEAKGGGWYAILPKDYQEKYAEQLKGFAKPKDLFDAYLSGQEKLKGAIVKPGENATDEERKAYLKALGVPDKYSLPKVGDEDKGYLGDVDGFNKWFEETAAKVDMTQEQAEAFYNLYVSANVQRAKDAAEARAKLEQEQADELNKEWGDKAKENFELSKRAFARYATPEFVKFVDANKLGTDPNFIRVFYEISQRISGDRGTDRTPGGTPAEERKGLKYNLDDRFPPQR